MKTKIIKKGGIAILGMLFLLSQGAFAQDEFYTVRGKVKDQKTKKEIVFGNVSIAGTHISTVTNLDGEFSIKIKKSLNAKELEFAHVGYNSKKVAISALQSGETEVYLKSSGKHVSEVTVRPGDAKKLIEMAMDKIPSNYSRNPLNSTGFYRETIKKRKDYLAISEALVDIYKSGYDKSTDFDKVKIYKGRKSSNVKRADTLAVKLQGGPSVSLLLDVIKNPYVLLPPEQIENYQFKISDIKIVDKNIMYEVSFSPKNKNKDNILFSGKYYIDVNSLGVSSVEFSMDLSDPTAAATLLVKRKPIGLKITPMQANYLVNYKKMNNRYFFDYSRNEVHFKCNWKKRVFNSNYTIMSELAITDWSMNPANKFSRKETLKKTDVFEEEVTAFTDKDFWGEYNTIEPDESLESAIQKYGKMLKRNKN